MKEGKDMVKTTNLPEGVTKHAVRVNLINNGRAEKIINKLAPGFYNKSIPKYYNVMRFLEKVRQDGTWGELWAEMEKEKDICKSCEHFWLDFPLPLERIESHCDIIDEKYGLNGDKFDNLVPYPCTKCPFDCYTKKQK